MITLFDRNYAANDGELVNSLFTKGRTCNGYYRRTRAGNIYLSDMQGKERAFIRHDGLLVSVSRHKGNRWYSFSTTTLDDRWLNTPDSIIERNNGARAAVNA